VIYALLKLAHVLAFTVWLGGMYYTLTAFRPAAHAVLDAQSRLKVGAATLERFFKSVSWAVVVLLVTGLVMMVMLKGARGMPQVHTMFALGLVMMAIFGHIRFASFPKLKRAVAAEAWADGAAAMNSIRKMVMINLVIGVIVVALAIVWRPGLGL
jgi:uncharacterized membrane protein